MARGGRVKPTNGANYSQRTDLRAPRPPSKPQVAPAGDQPYGAREAQLKSIQQLPLPNAAAQTPSPAPASAAAGVAPGTLPPINRPTERPGEPVTAGAASGPGPGPVVPMVQPTDDPSIEELRAVYLAFPNEDLRELIEDYDTGRTF